MSNSIGHNGAPSKTDFEIACAGVKAAISQAFKDGEAADKQKGSSTQRIACAIITYHGALIADGRKPAAWSELAENGSKSQGDFKKTIVTDIVGIPEKCEGEDPTKGAKEEHRRVRNAASNRVSEGLKLAVAMIALAIDVNLDPKTKLLVIPTDKLIAKGNQWSSETYGKMPATMLLDGKAFKTLKPAKSGDGFTDHQVFRDARTLCGLASGILVERKKRGADANKSETAKTAENALKGMPASAQAEGISRAAKDIVLVNADFAMLVRAVAKHLKDLNRSDAAPITPETYSRETRAGLTAIAEYVHGVINPALKDAA